jgi:poly-gamma-glutamate capsule biosynthesis protein CapA/YwtB (metallophosphatase superfamily)
MRPNQRLRRRKSKKPLLIFVLIVVLVLAGGGVWAMFFRETTSNTASNNKTQAEESYEKYPKRIRLVASGDTVVHDAVNLNAKNPDGSYDYYPMLSSMTPLYDNADIRFCNQVTPAGGKDLGVKGYPKFNAPTELVRDLGKMGCNLVNTASNHSFDTSQEAINNNVNAWKNVENTLAVVGQNSSPEEGDEVHTFEVRGVKFAFLAYTTYVNADAPTQNDYGVNRYSREFAGTQIAQAKKAGAEIIITSMRWGTEFSSEIDAAQESEGLWLADRGVDVILGHGPHVLQPVKEIEKTDGTKTVIWYSLGNFLNTQLETEALFNGLAVMDFDVESKSLTSISYLPVYSSYSWTTDQAAREDLLSRKNVKLYQLDDVTQELINANQIKTTSTEQAERIKNILNTHTSVPLLTKDAYLN